MSWATFLPDPMPSPATQISTLMTQTTHQLSFSPTLSFSTQLMPRSLSTLLTHPSPTPLSSNTCNHPWRTSLLLSGLASQIGCTTIMSSHTKVASTSPWRTPSVIPSLPTATIMRLLVTLDTSKSANLSPQNSGGQVLHNTCRSMLRAVPHASKTSQTCIPLSHHLPQLSLSCPALSNRSPMTLSPTSPSLLALIHCWSWSTMALQRG